MFTLIAMIAFLALLPAVAWRWGTDSRDGRDWSQVSATPARHPFNLPEAWVSQQVDGRTPALHR